MSRYELHDAAKEDIYAILEYVAVESSPHQAERVLASLLDTFELLGEQPRVGRPVDGILPGAKLFTGVGAARSYLIYFYPDDEMTEIARVVHGMRDQPAALDGDEA